MPLVSNVVNKYQEILNSKLSFKFSSNRSTLGKPGVANRLFIIHLCQDCDLFLNFVKETGLIRSDAVCGKCGGNMKLKPRKSKSDGFVWVCKKTSNGKVCETQKSIRYGSWFTNSKLRMDEIFFLTYELVKGKKTSDIEEEYFFSSRTLADWRQFINEKILDHIEETSEKIGGVGKTVEIDESKFGKRKYHKGHAVDGQWVFGGIERDSGKVFLVAVHDRSQETLVAVIKNWIEPGTTIYSDCWKAYNSLGKEGYDHLTVNHSLTFVDPTTGCHTNTIESTWRHVKSSLPTHNRQTDFKFYLAFYMFRKSCKEQKIDCYNKFLEIVRDVNWEEFKINV